MYEIWSSVYFCEFILGVILSQFTVVVSRYLRLKEPLEGLT